MCWPSGHNPCRPSAGWGSRPAIIARRIQHCCGVQGRKRPLALRSRAKQTPERNTRAHTRSTAPDAQLPAW
eukprot:6549134-Alexandrium_andersonii.AAC.1